MPGPDRGARHHPALNVAIDGMTTGSNETAEGLLRAARAALAEGELLSAFDAAATGLAVGGEQPGLRYVQILALARMGELDRAQRLYDAHLAAITDDVDSLALRARLIKDRAWHAGAREQDRLLREASAAYALVYDRTGDVFPAINAATLAYLAGDRARATALATAVLTRDPAVAPTGYYDAVTAAEAWLLLGNEAEATRLVDLAMTLPGCDQGARSTTCRQFARLAAAGVPADVPIARLRPPPVLTFCGHLFRHSIENEAKLGEAIARICVETGVRFAYGALGCGADIVIAETLLAHGCDLHVVLPFRAEDFIRTSVAGGGEAWIARFHACLGRAREVVIASESSALDDDRQYEYGSMLSMGYARLRAGHLGTRAIQLAVWDGRETGGAAGTAADVRQWRRHGGDTLVVPLDRSVFVPPPPVEIAAPTLDRVVRAMIFTDFAGFSRIDERALPDFRETVMGASAAVIDRHATRVCSRNSWGDALFVTTVDAHAAALLALELQAALLAERLDRFGPGAGMRVSAHIGAVYQAIDPVTRATTFYGHEVNKAARIEPITSVGEVYVSRAFAAVLEMEAPAAFDLSYAGRVALAKGFGTLPMYRLGRFAA